MHSFLKQSLVVDVAANYTSQRCPHCGIIRKENHDHINYDCINGSS